MAEKIKTLTPKQEKFAQCVADGMSQADAYRTAYSVSPNTKNETIQSKASILMADGRVRARVNELRKKLEDIALWTREESIQTLKNVLSMLEAKPGDHINAVKELNNMLGFNAPQKVDLNAKGFSFNFNMGDQ